MSKRVRFNLPEEEPCTVRKSTAAPVKVVTPQKENTVKVVTHQKENTSSDEPLARVPLFRSRCHPSFPEKLVHPDPNVQIFTEIQNLVIFLENTTNTKAIFSHPLKRPYSKVNFDIEMQISRYPKLEGFLNSGRAVIPPVRIYTNPSWDEDDDGYVRYWRAWLVTGKLAGKWVTMVNRVSIADDIPRAFFTHDTTYVEEWLIIPQNNEHYWHIEY